MPRTRNLRSPLRGTEFLCILLGENVASNQRRSTRAALLAVVAAGALVVSACGGTTTNPNAAISSAPASPGVAATGGSSSGPAGTSVPASGKGSASAASSAALTSGSAASTTAAAGGNGQPAPLDLKLPADPTLAASVPAKIKAAGQLIIATDATYAPNEFLVNGAGSPVGMDVDLGTAIAQVLGLKVEFKKAGFDGILAGINAGRFDLSLSSFTDNVDREKVVNFVNYFNAGTSTMVLAGNPLKINSDLDLCGKKVGAENGTTQLSMLQKADSDDSVVKVCTSAGKPAPTAQGYPTQTDVNGALLAGRIDAYLADSPVVAYAVKQTGAKFQTVGKDIGVAPYGIAVPKEPAALTPAIQKALQKLIDNGSYTKILTNWGVASGGVKTATINAAGSKK